MIESEGVPEFFQSLRVNTEAYHPKRSRTVARASSIGIASAPSSQLGIPTTNLGKPSPFHLGFHLGIREHTLGQGNSLLGGELEHLLLELLDRHAGIQIR